MKNRVLFVFLNLFLGAYLWAHQATDDLRPQEMIRVYESLLKKFELPFNAPQTSGRSWFLFENKMVAYDESAMNLALSSAIVELNKLQGQLEFHLEEEGSEKSQNFFVKKYQAFVSFLKKVPASMLKLTGTSVRMTQEHGFVLFAVIAATQISWEALETAVSVSIGAGGAHVACTIFNAALLASATSAQKALKLMASDKTNWSLRHRAGFTVRSLLRAFKAAFSLNKMFVSMGPGAHRLNSSQFEEMLDEKGIALSSMEDFFVDRDFIAPVWATLGKNEIQKGYSTVWHDVEAILDESRPSTERYLILETHVKGIRLLPRLLEQLAMKSFFSAEEQGEFLAGLSLWSSTERLREFFKVEILVGLMNRVIAEYKLLLEPFANSSELPQSPEKISLIREKLRLIWMQLLDLLSEGLVVAETIEKTKKVTTEQVIALKQKAKELIRAQSNLRRKGCAAFLRLN